MIATVYGASVGAFNLNNLFSRFNYEAEVAELSAEEAVINSSTTFPVANPTAHRSFRVVAIVSQVERETTGMDELRASAGA